MNDKEYSFLSINYSRENDSFFQEKNFNSNNDFNLKKYEKFQPKETLNKYTTLRGAENKVKNLLSKFLHNYEVEKKSSDILFDSITLKSKEMNSILNRNKKKLKKVKTISNNDDWGRSSTFNITAKNNNNNLKVGFTPEKPSHQIYTSKKRKVMFNLKKRPSNLSLHKKGINLISKKSKNSQDNMNDLLYSKTFKFKRKMEGLIDKVKSIGSEIFNKNMTIDKPKKRNLKIHRKSYKANDSNSLIKKYQFYYNIKSRF